MTFNMDGTGRQEDGFSPGQRAQLEEMMSAQQPGKREQKRLARRAARQRILGAMQDTVDAAAPQDGATGFDRTTVRGRAAAWFSRSALTRAALGIAVIAVILTWCVVVLGGNR
jgi:hypothetical protein